MPSSDRPQVTRFVLFSVIRLPQQLPHRGAAALPKQQSSLAPAKGCDLGLDSSSSAKQWSRRPQEPQDKGAWAGRRWSQILARGHCVRLERVCFTAAPLAAERCQPCRWQAASSPASPFSPPPLPRQPLLRCVRSKARRLFSFCSLSGKSEDCQDLFGSTKAFYVPSVSLKRLPPGHPAP